jgi:hypothetical protein
MKLLNVRADDDLFALVDEATLLSDSRNRSEWCREALEYVARREIEQARRAHNGANGRISGTATPVPSLGLDRGASSRLGASVAITGCLHPPQARHEGVTVETCRICGEVTRLIV